MLGLYIGIGAGVLVFLYIILQKFLTREKRWKTAVELYKRRGDYIMAVDFAKRLINLRPLLPDYHIQLAELYIAAKMSASAITTYENMIKKKIFSNKWREHNIREKIALVYIEEAKIVEAFKELYRVLREQPNSALALGLMARIYGSQLKYEKAINYLKKAISISPNIAEFHYLIGIAYLDTGDLSQAIVELDQANKLDNKHLKAQYFLALAARQKGLTEKANDLFNKLNITDKSKLPDNVTQLGIMAQKVPKFNIEELEEKLAAETSVEKSDTKTVDSINDLLSADVSIFHNTALKVISKLGYIIKDEVKNRLIDMTTEVDFIAVAKKYKGTANPSLTYIQFNRTSAEIGTIPLADFISKMKEMNVNTGVFITTSSFAKVDYDKVSKEKIKITLIDSTKLTRYL